MIVTVETHVIGAMENLLCLMNVIVLSHVKMADKDQQDQ
jgi:hypothetical protein